MLRSARQLLVLPLLALGCSAPEPTTSPEASSNATNLLDSAFVRVRSESATLHFPPNRGPNRLASGWKPLPQDPSAVRPTFPDSTIELVQVEERPRTLRLEMEVPGGSGAGERGSVQLLDGNEVLSEAAAQPTTILPIPALAAPESHVLRLRFEARPRPILHSATIDAIETGGDSRRVEEGFVHYPGSFIEILHRSGGGHLSLSFQRLRPLKSGQSFEVWVQGEREVTPRLARHWSPETADSEASAPFEVELTPGVSRLILRARGDGPPGLWTGFAFEETATPEASASLVDRQVESRPKLVVLYVLDALRADALADRSKDTRTPTLAKLAREGVRFEAHRSVAPNTLPSTASLFHGRIFPRVLDPRDVRDVGTPLAQHFRAAGFETAIFSANPYVSESFHMTGGFDYVEPVPEAAVTEVNRSSEDVVSSFEAWLAAREKDDSRDRPLFLYLHVLNPHNPFTAPSEFSRRPGASFVGDTPTLVALKDGSAPATDESIEAIRTDYADTVAYADAILTRLLATLEAQFTREEMALVVTSDHGEELLEPHRGVLHGFTLYEESVRIPLILWPSEIFGTSSVTEQTTNLDTHRLVRSLAEGRRSLLQISEDALPRISVMHASGAPRGIVAVTDGRWKVVLTGTRRQDWGMGDGRWRTWDTEYLFDLDADDGETVNRLGEGGLPVRWMRELARDEGAKGTRTPVGPAPPLDPAVQAELEALGYT